MKEFEQWWFNIWIKIKTENQWNVRKIQKNYLNRKNNKIWG